MIFFFFKSTDVFLSTQISVLSDLKAHHLFPTAQNCQPLLPVMDLGCCWWERVEGEKRKHKQQISGILQRIRSWELESVLLKWWNGSPKGPRLRSTQLVTKRSSLSERREGMINTLDSTQLLNFLIMFFFFFLLVRSKQSCSSGFNMSFVFVWEFECDRRAESDEGQRTGRS